MNAFFKQNFEDGLGEGAFGYRHFIWMGLTVLMAVALYQIFRREKNKRYARPILVALCVLLFTVRTVNQIYRAAAGYEVPAGKAIPWHLCTMLTFVMPVVYVFRIKLLKPAVYSMCVIGAVMTLIFGEYFDNSIITIFNIEGMWAHMMLLFVPVVETAVGNFRFEFKIWWQTTIGMLICMGWATVGNTIFEGSNFMYLVKNALPFSVPHVPFILLYVVLYAVFLTVMYGAPTLWRKFKAARGKKSLASEAAPLSRSEAGQPDRT